MSREYSILLSHIKNLGSRYFHSLSAFYVWESLEEQVASNIVGAKEARMNVDVMSRFKSFFVMSKQALHVYWLLELAKLFDDMKQSLHISKLINYAESNKGKLSKEEFLQLNKDRRFAKELYERYQGISQEDLNVMREKLKKHEKTIQKLNSHRDEHLAHNDIKKKKVNLNRKEIAILFDLVKDILNLFSQKLDFSTTSYKHVEGDCKTDTKRLIENLKKYEQFRLKEVRGKYERLKKTSKASSN